MLVFCVVATPSGGWPQRICSVAQLVASHRSSESRPSAKRDRIVSSRSVNITGRSRFVESHQRIRIALYCAVTPPMRGRLPMHRSRPTFLWSIQRAQSKKYKPVAIIHIFKDCQLSTINFRKIRVSANHHNYSSWQCEISVFMSCQTVIQIFMIPLCPFRLLASLIFLRFEFKALSFSGGFRGGPSRLRPSPFWATDS